MATILVAEDNPVNQEVICGLLENLGCRVRVVGNGTEAVDVLAKDDYDLVFMDCHMPDMDGFRATRTIREREARMNADRTADGREPVHLPIIALTADIVEGTRQECLAAGMDDYATKPFKKDSIREVLRAHLPAPGRAAASATQDVRQAGSTPAVPVAAEVQAIDARVLNNLRALEAQGATGLVARVIEVYLRDAANHVQTIRDAVARGDAGVIHERAHSLKSASANLGAMEIAALCKELERMGRSNTLEAAEAEAARLAAEFERARAVLARERTKETT